MTSDLRIGSGVKQAPKQPTTRTKNHMASLLGRSKMAKNFLTSYVDIPQTSFRKGIVKLK